MRRPALGSPWTRRIVRHSKTHSRKDPLKVLRCVWRKPRLPRLPHPCRLNNRRLRRAQRFNHRFKGEPVWRCRFPHRPSSQRILPAAESIGRRYLRFQGRRTRPRHWLFTHPIFRRHQGRRLRRGPSCRRLLLAVEALKQYCQPRRFHRHRAGVSLLRDLHKQYCQPRRLHRPNR